MTSKTSTDSPALRTVIVVTALAMGSALGGLGIGSGLASADRGDSAPGTDSSQSAAEADGPDVSGRGRASSRRTADVSRPRADRSGRHGLARPDQTPAADRTAPEDSAPPDEMVAESPAMEPANRSSVAPAAATRPAAVPAAPLASVLVSVAPASVAPAEAVTVEEPTPSPSAPVLTAAHPADSISTIPAPLFGAGTGLPTESPASWVVLAATRRMGRVATRRTAAATVTTGQPTGQLPLPAATTGTTTVITWSWGTNPVLAFNPATDKLDFGWMRPSEFDVTEKSGSTVIAVVGNNHTYTLSNVPISQLQMSNIVAKDTGTVSKWQTLISGAQATSPSIAISNASVAEGNSGTTNAAFTVTLSKASTKTVTVGYSTANGTASAGQDYTATSGTVTFAPGATSQKINVAVIGDTAVEPNETFTVKLSNPGNATLGSATGTGTIANDDVAPTLPAISIANATVAEGNSGTTNAAFTVTLSKASDKTVTVGYSTANGTATAGQDYAPASGTLSFAPGTTTQQVNVAVTGDTTVEPTETFTVTLASPTGATLGTATATGSITNDDVSVPPIGTVDRWGKAFFAPYVDMAGWPVPNLLQISQATGASLMTAAFIQATPDGKPAWAGLSALAPDATNDQALAINKAIRDFKAAGGDVMISFGGQAGTSLAQYYSAHGLSAQALANTYVGVIDTYGVNHIDFDIEGAAVADPASIALNSQAIKLVQQARPEVQVWYTLPVLPTGLTADGLKVVDSALAAGVRLAGVNVMAMDYGESAAPTSGPNAQTMGTYAIRSAEATFTQLSSLYSKRAQTFTWSQLGVTPMLGVNDITSEVFTLADAQAVEDFARSKGLGMLSMWSITRDTPGTLGQSTPTASGLSAPAGSFSKIFNDYGTVNTVSYGSTSTGSTSTGSTGTVTGGATTPIGWHWGTNTALNFNTATDKLDFGWMQPTSFDITEKSGSTVITIVNNNQTYTLSGVPLRSMQIGNIIALDPNTVAKWQAAITAARL